MLSLDVVRAVLHYDLVTGLFSWLRSPNKRIRVGTPAGNLSKDGYIRISINSRSYQAHRLAVFYVTGKWPERFVDHRNTVRCDNKWTNLRLASDELNLQNQIAARSNSSTGLLGVVPLRGRFIARIKVKGKQHHLGIFDTAQEAHQAYVDSKRKLHEGCTI